MGMRYRSDTGAAGSRFQFSRIPIAFVTAALLVASATCAAAGEFRDSAGAFTIAYDEAIWRIAPGGEAGSFEVRCQSEACGGIVAGCSGSRLWVPFASVGRLTREFDARDTERAVMLGLAAEKASTDKANKTPNAEDVAPAVVKPYTLMHTRAGHPVHDSDYRVSLGGRVTRFLSFSTAARSHSIALVCHVPEERLEVWRPRFDALIEGFRAAPEPFWLRWLGYVGL
jgi:hypothetical protein